jgi:hypothetical protein
MAKARKASRKKTRKPRRGRDLEQLVALLEKILGPTADVRSPDRLADRDTGEPREVDVSIRSTVGSTTVLAIGECRDRQATQDATWIEQLAEKALSVGAKWAIAVSKAGFFEPAIKKAAARGVEIRVLESITPEAVLEAVRLKGFRLLVGRMDLLAATIQLEPVRGFASEEEFLRELMAVTGELNSVTEPYLTITRNGSRCSVLEAWNRVVASQRSQGVKIDEDVPTDGTRVRKNVVVAFPKPMLDVVLPSGKAIAVAELRVVVDLWFEVSEQGPAAAYSYGAPGASLLETVEYHVDLRPYGGTRQAIAIHREPESVEFKITHRTLK